MAADVCTRCGTFLCDACGSPEPSRCAACATLAVDEALPRASRRAAWKLVLVPAIGLGCVGVLARHGSLPSLEAEQAAFLLAWLLPFGCGLGLLIRPSALLAFLGSLGALLLIATALGPALVLDFSVRGLIDVVLLSAAPAVALADALELDRAHRRRRLLMTLAST